ncbi:hypothetical protein [Kibdelosporangium philippinense]|uniref:hypothetical protein n=1 Tax=Kibdelosporangium philippinense TaxID=211113 RepID=UPI003621F8F1
MRGGNHHGGFGHGQPGESVVAYDLGDVYLIRVLPGLQRQYLAAHECCGDPS